jgi:hypothetical protein
MPKRSRLAKSEVRTWSVQKMTIWNPDGLDFGCWLYFIFVFADIFGSLVQMFDCWKQSIHNTVFNWCKLVQQQF